MAKYKWLRLFTRWALGQLLIALLIGLTSATLAWSVWGGYHEQSSYPVLWLVFSIILVVYFAFSLLIRLWDRKVFNGLRQRDSNK